ncbi:MAG: ATP-binding protein [Bacteroidetes bacterium]|nr:ATP-binding protein [Bacteroidota bacterium]MCL5737224.1 ATP-binding protein [Bacteroidota bacterium]
MSTMIYRNIAPKLLDALHESPVTLLVGARQTGKSTLAEWIAREHHKARYITLDDATMLAAAKNDPSGFLHGFDENLIIDEVQRAPELFLAIKSVVDRKRTPGRFLLTGSANVLFLPKVAESLAGRMEIIKLFPFSDSEIDSKKGSFLDRVFEKRIRSAAGYNGKAKDIQERMIRGGFPEVIQRTRSERRAAWFESYITAILQRDIRDISNVEGLTALPRLLSLIASRSSTLLNYAELSNSSGIPQTTLKRYMALFDATFLVQLLPAWSSNFSKRLIKAPKVFITDTGLTAHLLGIDNKRLSTDHVLLGKMLECHVFSELSKHQSWSKDIYKLYHFRTAGGEEVDFLIERADGLVVGFEVKSSSTVDAGTFKNLRSLAKEKGKDFVRGVVLYTGEEYVPFEEKLIALPIHSL